MDLTQYVSDLRHQLTVAAEAGGDDARALAERLTAPLESAARLALLDALSAAAAEITRDLAPGSVDVRLRGREPTFVVTLPPADEPLEDPGCAPRAAPGRPRRPKATKERCRGSTSACPNTSRPGSRTPQPATGSRSTPGSSGSRRLRCSTRTIPATRAAAPREAGDSGLATAGAD